MTHDSLRKTLRSHTSGLHARLDAVVGAFDDEASYRAFVINSYRFRTSAEACLMECPAWHIEEIAPLVRRDLDDLGVGEIEAGQLSVGPSSSAAMIGGLYVLEGSSLGARVLFRRALQLGFDENYAARHLAHQTEDTARWPRFMTFLETAEVDHDAALFGARSMFELALSSYSEPASERA